MNYTDDQLKQALAKMLPNVIDIFTVEHSPEIVLVEKQTGAQYRDTELLHLCWMVEETIKDRVGFVRELFDVFERAYCDNEAWDCLDPVDISAMLCHATWQERTVALAKVKGVEIV
jgi:hypothetical protein